MNLAIDIGNTAVKLGLFEGGQMIETAGFQPGEAFKMETLLRGRKVKRGIVCSVNKELDWVIRIFEKEIEGLIIYPGSLRLPVTSAYRSPETLGADRIPPLIGAMTSDFVAEGHKDPSPFGRRGNPIAGLANPILVIDAG